MTTGLSCVSSPHREATDIVVPVQAPELHARSDAEPRAPVRPSRRVALVPEPGDTPQSLQDRHPTWQEWVLSCPWIPPTATVLFRWTNAFWAHWKTFSHDGEGSGGGSILGARTAQWGTEGPFAVLTSEPEEVCPRFEATTVLASSNAVSEGSASDLHRHRVVHRGCGTHLQTSPAATCGRSVTDGAHCSRCPRQPRRTAPASEGSHLAGVAQHAQRGETSQGHGQVFGGPCWPRGPQRRRHPQGKVADSSGHF